MAFALTRWWLLLLVLAALSPAMAQPLRPLPPILQSVSDEVGALSRQEGRELADQVEEVRQATGARIVIVVAETTGSEDIEQYTERLAQRWERGGLDRAHAVFVVIAVGDRALRVVAGSGLESLRRELEGPSMTSDLPALFRQRHYFEALQRLTARIGTVIAPKATKSAL